MSENRRENSHELEIDIGKICLVCLKNWWLFLLVVAVFAGSVFVFAKTTNVPKYQSTIKIFVNVSYNEDSGKVSSPNMSTGSQLVKLFNVFLNTNDMLVQIADKADLPYSAETLKKMLSTGAVGDTQVFYVTVTSSSEVEARNIAQTIGEVFPKKISETIEGTYAKVIESANLSTFKLPDTSVKKAIIGALIGFIVCAGAVAFFTISDTTVHGKEDVVEITQIPILVQIPNLSDVKTDKRNRYNKYNAKYQYYSRTGDKE